MIRRLRQPPRRRAAPIWMVTFGDMMALLLCFFILLQMFSELKKDREYQQVVTAVREAFGYSGQIGVLPVDDVSLRSMIEHLDHLALKRDQGQEASRRRRSIIEGEHVYVKRINEGISFTIGGPTLFDPCSADVKDTARPDLERLAALLRGRRNKVEIRAHGTPLPSDDDCSWDDLETLCFARARAVRDLLVEHGVQEYVFRLVVIGDREPVRPRAGDPLETAENRRVEIILTEALVDDMNTDLRFTDPDGARGGGVARGDGY